MSHLYLNFVERYYIRIERKKEVSINQVAKIMKYPQNTIRGIRHNTGQRNYKHKQANHLTYKRHAKKNQGY